MVCGDPERVEPVDADPERGAFLAPILLRVDDPGQAAPHEVEAFGPVASLLPYATTEQVIALAAKGRGSLVGSVVTGDTGFAREVVLGVAPWHGRLLVLDTDDAKESTGHGSPLPVLVHGGPGRAGGGEEMGGIRGVLHHMQRTAVQASPETLTAITGRWVQGAARREGTHPFRKSLAELRVGDCVVAGPRTVTRSDIAQFAELTGDTFYAHTDEEAARANPLFGGIVAHGYLVLSLAAGLFVAPEPGPVLANYGLENLRFLTPVKPGDELTVTLTAKQITPRVDADYGEVRWDTDVTNQRGESAARYDVLTLVAKERDRVTVAERLALAGAADVAPPDGHAVRQRACEHPEQFLVTGRASHHQDLAEVVPQGPHRTPEILGQHGELEPQPDRPPLTRPMVTVERQQAARPVHREHAGRGRRADLEKAAGAVLGLEPLGTFHPQARAALDPFCGRQGNPQRLRDRSGEQVARSRRHHLGIGGDDVHRSRAHIHDDGVRPGAGSSQRPEAGSGGFGRHAADRAADKVGELASLVGASHQPVQRRGHDRPARGCPAARSRRPQRRRGPRRTGRRPRRSAGPGPE